MARAKVIVFAYHDVGYECLEVLLKHHVDVIALFTHNDNPKEEIWFKSVAQLAKLNNVPVFTAENPNTAEVIKQIAALKPDLIFSFYYRHMISEAILQLPQLGAFNMHGSLLPKYRGRVPINWAIIHGETKAGATLHHMVKRPDAGDIVDQEAVTIGSQDTAKMVFTNVTAAARVVLERQLPALLQGNAPRHPQDEKQATYFSGRKPEDGVIQWSQSAQQIFNLIRAITHPYPGAYTFINGKRFFIWWAQAKFDLSAEVGQVISTHPLCVGTGDGYLEIKEWQWEDSPTSSFDNSHGLELNQRLDLEKLPLC